MDWQVFIRGLVGEYKTLPVRQLKRYAEHLNDVGSFKTALRDVCRAGLYECGDGIIRLRNLSFDYVGICDRYDMFQTEQAIHKAFAVLTDFAIMMPVFTHFPTLSYPYVLVFAADEGSIAKAEPSYTVYEVLYIEDGKEGLANIILRQKGADGDTKRIAVIESEEQMTRIDPVNIEFFATVSPDGNVEYIREEE